jgi:hypothetical protein
VEDFNAKTVVPEYKLDNFHDIFRSSIKQLISKKIGAAASGETGPQNHRKQARMGKMRTKPEPGRQNIRQNYPYPAARS